MVIAGCACDRQQLGEPRDRVVAAINYLEEQGDDRLAGRGCAAGVQAIEEAGGWQCADAQRWPSDSSSRERRDLDRLNEVMAFASFERVPDMKLLAYFGEPAEKDCGHCGWCRGHRPGPVPPPVASAAGERGAGTGRSDPPRTRRRSWRRPDRSRGSSAGLRRPAAEAKLGKDPRFGPLAAVPFRDVLALVEEALSIDN